MASGPGSCPRLKPGLPPPPHVLVLLHEAEPSSLRRKAEKSAAQALAGKRKKGPKYSLKARIVDGVSLCVSECVHLCLCMHAACICVTGCLGGRVHMCLRVSRAVFAVCVLL